MKKSFGYYISAIYRHLQIYLNQQFTEYGFGSGQYLFFMNIAHHEGISQKELSRLLAIDKATTAKAIKKLTELGYVRAVQNSSDKRILNLYLTNKGEEIRPRIQKILSGTLDVLKRNMEPDEIERTEEILNRILGNITVEVDQIRSLNE